MPLAAGERLGRYQIVALIGKGGMGEVYKATDTLLGRTVAVKTVKTEHAARFEREVRAIAALNHPNICQLYDVGSDYLVMEFVEGVILQGPLPLEQALRFAKEICDALEAAHRKKITHRDLKPSNILVTSSGVKLLDFGLAKIDQGELDAPTIAIDPDQATLIMGITQAGAILGTAAYMAPEQAIGRAADPRSDIFSFGLVLFEMLTGRRAFYSGSPLETMGAIAREPTTWLQELPQEVSAIVARCVNKVPEDRYQSMHEVRTALKQIVLEEKPRSRTPSIAVLPFSNLSADKENEYFCDGLAEEILNSLAKIPNLKVIARTSSFAFRGKEQDIRKIAKILDTSYVLEGSVRRAGNRLRVTAQLVHASDGTHVWSGRYDRDITDVFAVQDEVGKAISEALQVRLAPHTQPVNIEAYQYYLKGQYFRVRYTPESLMKAKDFFEQALAIDPTYALAYNGLAAYYYLLAGVTKPASNAIPFAKAAAEKALSIDPTLSEARSVLAASVASFDYNWPWAETQFRLAMEEKPVPSLVRHRYAFYHLIPQGRIRDAIEQSRWALETDPLAVVLHVGLATSLCLAKRYEESVEQARRALEIDSSSYLLWGIIGMAQLVSGAIPEAIASLERAAELAPWLRIGAGLLAAAYYLAGDQEHRLKAESLESQLGESFGAATYYAALGQEDLMFRALDEAYRQRDRSLLLAPTLAIFDRYRADPRFQSLLRQMNLV